MSPAIGERAASITSANPDVFSNTRLWLDAGDADPFRPGDEVLTQALGERVSGHTWPGGHDGDYWNAHWPDYARFYARALDRC